MKITKVEDRNRALVDQLVKIWESSVKATHLFLLDDEICNIKKYVPQAIMGVPVLIVAEDEKGMLVGFMGVADKMLKCYLFQMKAENKE